MVGKVRSDFEKVFRINFGWWNRSGQKGYRSYLNILVWYFRHLRKTQAQWTT